MHLTRLSISDLDAVSKRLSDSYAWHRAIWTAFADDPGKSRSFLTRVDHDRDGFRAHILSEEKPITQSWGSWESRPVAPTFLGHDRYRFDLRANPIVSRVVRSADGTRRKNNQRIPLTDPDALTEWLDRKGELAGFRVEACNIDGPRRDKFWHPRRKSMVTLSVVDFTGILAVRDRIRFMDAHASGVGPAKGFGCGLLLLLPLR